MNLYHDAHPAHRASGAVVGPDQCLIRREEAVHCQTWAGAYAQFAEGPARHASEPGMLADVAVLSRDVFAAAPDDVRTTHADITLRGGTCSCSTGTAS